LTAKGKINVEEVKCFRRSKLATKVIMPVLGMAQDTGKLISWLIEEGEGVIEGEPIMEVETDKATVEIEAAASGTLGGVRAQEGDEVPVGQVIAWILEPGESTPEETMPQKADLVAAPGVTPKEESKGITSAASPVAQKMAVEHGIDLALVNAGGDRIQKADVLAYIKTRTGKEKGARLTPASPKARRLAAERDIDITTLSGSGLEGAVLAGDILAIDTKTPQVNSLTLSTVWQRMAERVTQSWTSAPHFYLLREVNASRLVAWRTQAKEHTGKRITYTDLLVKLVAAALRQHPQANAAWNHGEIFLNDEINIGLAIAIEDGLIVPVIHQADQLSLSQITDRRSELVRLAQDGKLGLEDLQGGTFTLTNLGMYGVDIFNAVLNPPQAAILAVGRITERVVPVNGQPAVQPVMMLSVSYDHRTIDGARGAQFLEALANLIEEPLTLLD
jgi:pyruvate dehydrogenase E2 component (dihydrolipoamide acetyltransferase)